MLRDYELMYIVRPDLDDDAVKTAMDSVQSIVEANGGEVVKTTPWGKRRLAYEIQKLRDGHYVLLEVRLDGARIKEVERTLRIHDQVFRHMVVALDHPSEGEVGSGEAVVGADGATGAALDGGPSADVEAGDDIEAPAAAPPVGEVEVVAQGGAAEVDDVSDVDDETDGVETLDDDEENS